MENIDFELENAESFGGIFDLVKKCVYDAIGRSRAGLMLGLSPLGFAERGFIGAYHQLGSNLIVLNQNLLEKIREEKPELLKYHVFHLLLHEYLHSLGVVDENTTRALAEIVTEKAFGPDHALTRIAKRFEEYVPGLKHSDPGYRPPEEAYVTLVDGFEKEDTGYIG
ncbi:MAG: hypothetical protein HYX24_05275 [Candidatus Aenigmarchaeota archaeon]|nr:hypothetical protein [Candidatus Aenigmarchaeota archaeon]